MTQGRKSELNKTGDHNWDMERMQNQKEKGNVSAKQNYVNTKAKAKQNNKKNDDAK